MRHSPPVSNHSLKQCRLNKWYIQNSKHVSGAFSRVLSFFLLLNHNQSLTIVQALPITQPSSRFILLVCTNLTINIDMLIFRRFYRPRRPCEVTATLKRRHNERVHLVSNRRRLGCLPNRLFRRRSNIVAGLCEWNLPVAVGKFPTQKASNAENVLTWWRHHTSPLSYM